MTTQPVRHHPGYWPWGDEPRPVEPTIPVDYRRPEPTGRGPLAVALEVLAAALVSAGVAAVTGLRAFRFPGDAVPGAGPDPLVQLAVLARVDVRHLTAADRAPVDPLLGLAPLTHLGRPGPVVVYTLVVFLPAVAASAPTCWPGSWARTRWARPRPPRRPAGRPGTWRSRRTRERWRSGPGWSPWRCSRAGTGCPSWIRRCVVRRERTRSGPCWAG